MKRACWLVGALLAFTCTAFLLQGETGSGSSDQQVKNINANHAAAVVGEIKYNIDSLFDWFRADRDRLESILEARVPEFFLPLGGEGSDVVRPIDLMGRGVLIFHFYATYCGPCKEEYPHISRFIKEEMPVNYELVMVSQDLAVDVSFEDLKKFLVENLGEDVMSKIIVARDDCHFQSALMKRACEMPQAALLSEVGTVVHREPSASNSFWKVSEMEGRLKGSAQQNH